MSFAERVKETKRKLLEFMIAAKRNGKQIAGYGADAIVLEPQSLREDVLTRLREAAGIEEAPA